MKRPTLQRIAVATGFSIATVSRALGGSGKISVEAKRLILKTAREMGYHIECRNVAVIVPDFSFSGYYGVLIEHLYEELVKSGFTPIVFSLKNLPILEETAFCGAISVMALNGLEHYWGKSHAMPLVCINTSPRHLDGIFTVGSHDYQGMQLAVEHLIRLGHRRIGRLGLPNSFGDSEIWNNINRDRAFRSLMADHNLPNDLCAVWQGVESLKELLRQNITAMIILNEGVELPALQGLRLLDIAVPEDLSVVCWSMRSIAPYLTPSVTAVHQDFDRLVRCGVELFRRLLAGETVCDDILVDYQLVVRASTSAV